MGPAVSTAAFDQSRGLGTYRFGVQASANLGRREFLGAGNKRIRREVLGILRREQKRRAALGGGRHGGKTIRPIQRLWAISLAGGWLDRPGPGHKRKNKTVDSFVG